MVRAVQIHGIMLAWESTDPIISWSDSASWPVIFTANKLYFNNMINTKLVQQMALEVYDCWPRTICRTEAE